MSDEGLEFKSSPIFLLTEGPNNEKADYFDNGFITKA